MAYDFVKLSETTLVESAADPNLLIEDGGEVKRISANNIATPQVQSDWNETDTNSSAFILNKPENIGKNNVITYTIASGMLMLNGATATAQSVIDAWNNGNVLRIASVPNTVGAIYHTEGNVIGIYYGLSGGKVMDKSCVVSYYLSQSLQKIII